MSLPSREQLRHDRINLACLVRRLEKSTAMDEWSSGAGYSTWLKAQDALQASWEQDLMILQRVKFCRKLLKNAEMYEEDPGPSTLQYFQDTRDKLERVEVALKEVEKRYAPTPSRPKSLLAQLPIPSMEEENAPAEPPPVPPTDDLLLSPSEPPISFPLPIPTLLPAAASLETSNATAVGASSGVAPKFLHNTSALQQELSEQLAQMATQLRRNAEHFSESLEKDKAVVEDAQQKIEGNLDVMTRERVRLRDHRGKSQSTTCLVVASLVTVCVLFVLMFFIIRFT